MRNSFMFLITLAVISLSCKKDQEPVPLPFDEQLAIDLKLIDAYLEDNNITDILMDCQTGSVTTFPDCNGDVKYQQQETGNGLYINTIDIPFIASYKGTLLDTGVEFDASDSASFTLRNVIAGWQVVLLDSREGDSLTLYIPSGYGYGFKKESQNDIPSNANLIFNIKIHQVN